MNKKFLLCLILLLVFIYYIFKYFKNINNFEIKIEANFPNIEVEKIDSSFAKQVKNELLQVEEIKKLIIFSRDNKCTIYSKIKPFILDKRQISDKIEKKLNLALNKTIPLSDISYENDYDLIYDTFIVVSSNKLSYNELKNICDEIFNLLLGERFSSKILKFGEMEKTIYINFNNSTLLRYQINLQDIIETIKNNNIITSNALKINEKTSYPIKINGKIENVEDIKNIVIPYKNNMFSIKFRDIFEIDEKITTPPNYLIKSDDKKAEIIAISKRKLYPKILYKYKLNKLLKKLDYKNANIKLVNTSTLKKIEINLDNRASIYDTEKLAKNIEDITKNKIDNIIYSIGHDIPKISSKEKYYENEKSKLILLVNKFCYKKLKNILEKNNINYIKNNSKNYYIYDTDINKLNLKCYQILNFLKNNDSIESYSIILFSKIFKINYHIYDYAINDYKVSKEDIINSILAINNSLFCDNYFEDIRKIPIYLQNKNSIKREYVYIKSTNSLAYLGTLSKNSLIESYYVIPRENENYFAKININYKNINLIKKFSIDNKLNKIIKKPFLK